MPREFLPKLLAGKVERFTLVQEANIGGSYIRCYYRLNDSSTPKSPCVKKQDADHWVSKRVPVKDDEVWSEETPLDTPCVEWKKQVNGVCEAMFSDNAEWGFINERYDCHKRPFVLEYVPKKAAPV